MSQLSFNGAAFVITILIFGCYGAHWGEQYTSCPGKFQYPIHIDKNVNLTKTKISEFVMKGFNVSATSAELRNTGQTLLINLTFVITPTIEGGPLKGKGVYKFSHFQFHWFDAESLHSSAKQYNVSYPFEFHIIFFNENFSSANQAQAFDNGIAVLAFSIMVGDIGFDGFKDIIELMKNVTVTNNSASFINPPQLNDLMHKFIFIYFTYTGTMLTPPCSADVIWIDFEDGIFLTNEQYSALDIFGNYWALKRNPNFRGIVHKREPEFVLDEEKGGAIPLSYARNKAHWGEQYTSCPGKFQYPIQDDKNVNLNTTEFTELVMKGFDVSATSAELRNTGQTLLLNLTFVVTPTIEGGPLEGKGVYKFSHFQFHWFEAQSLPSYETSYESPYNVSYRLELDIIFFNEKFSSANQAQAFDNGIAVLAFSIMVIDIDCDEFKEIIKLVKNVTVPNNSAFFTNPPQLKDLMQKYLFIYYTYTGTMFTPPCSADVIWIDFEDKIFLSNEQNLSKGENCYDDLSENDEPKRKGPRLAYSLDFGYDGHMGPDHWGEQYDTCDGKFQSPINIEDLKVLGKYFKPLVMKGFNVKAESAEVFNNGHTVLANLKFAETPTIESGPLEGKGVFKFSQFHFHWGDNDTIGSEDRINNKAYPAELHMVFYNERYDSVNEALTFDGGIVVLAFFYKFRTFENYKYNELTTLLEKVQEPNKRASFTNPPQLEDFIHDNLTYFYTYTGSLTTPPCSEEVIWIDFEDPIRISPAQLDRFRSLYTHDGLPLKHNFRPIQRLNNRTVYKTIPRLSPVLQVSDEVEKTNNDEVPACRDKMAESSSSAPKVTGKPIFILLLIYIFFKIVNLQRKC